MTWEAQGITLPWYARYRVDLPEMEFGPWRLVHNHLSAWREADSELVKSWSGVRVPPLLWPGRYHILQREETHTMELGPDDLDYWFDEESSEPLKVIRTEYKTWMADSPVEIATQATGIRRLRGRVLIGGLGLGVMVKAALTRRDVTAVDVVELDPEIIRAIGPFYKDPRVRIINADFDEFRPTGRAWYDCVWCDIWRDVGLCNIVSMLKCRVAWTDRCGWYGAWSEDQARVRWRDGDVGALSAESCELIGQIMGWSKGEKHVSASAA